jgi:hypothetical protein
MPGVEKIEGTDFTYRVKVDQLRAGWVTRSFPHLIPDDALYVADNVVFNRDGLVSKRPGNSKYGGGSGATGSGQPILAMTRFYPAAGPQLLVHSGTQLYVGNDSTGAFTSVGTGLTSARGANFAQQRDPDMSTGNAIALFVCDGARIPQVYDGAHFVPVSTAAGFLPNGIVTGTPIKPSLCLNWREHMVYAGDPDDPSALWISDAFRPERFSGYAILDSAGTSYIPYYPGGADGALGSITGIAQLGPYLVIFMTAGVVAAINTGTYGAFQYQFTTISATTGMPAPRSLKVFEGFAIFFGGDRFYATDGTIVVPLPDEVPSVYANSSASAFPSEMRSRTSVVGVRRGTQYWAAYDNVGGGRNLAIVVFDLSANGGYQFGAKTGGAWSRWPTGMPLGAAVECRGPGDSQQLFWGSSSSDLVLQHDTGTYDDWGSAIAMEVRAKAFFLDQPINPKKVMKLYVLLALPALGAQYTEAVQAYVVFDSSTAVAPAVAVLVKPSGVAYGTLTYGTFNYGSAAQIIQTSAETFPQVENQGNSVQPGVTESSKNPCNIIGFVMELIVDPVPF